MSNTKYLDRIEASKILKVSTRTVDRYMRKYRLKTRKDGRRVLIKRVDIDKIIQDQVGHLVDMNAAPAAEAPVAEKAAVKVSGVKVEKVKETSKNAIEEKIYKDLYSEVKTELKEKQDRLEAATYRVGQLESQVKNMVPMLDYDSKERELKETKENLEQRVKQNNEVIAKMEVNLRSERVAKWIYLSLVGTLLVVEPILFLWWAFN